jgi:hypothetical protein
VTRLTALGAGIALGLVLVSPAAGALEVRVSITPKRPHALEPATVELRTFAPLIRADGSCCRLKPWSARSYAFRVEAVSPEGRTTRVRVRWARGNEWRGVVRFARPGHWQLQLPQFGQSIAVAVRPAVPTPAPPGFGPLGRPGCAPPSPTRTEGGLREIFGTAVGGEQLWALPFLGDGARWAGGDSAVLEELVGKRVKIVFAMTSVRAPFHAVSPKGETVEPVWRQGHVGPTWVGIPGHQWGAGFVFSEPGCWRIRVGSRGDVWLLIRS